MSNIVTDIEKAAANLVKHLVSEEAMLHLELQGVEHNVFAALFTAAVHVAAGAGEAALLIDRGIDIVTPLLDAVQNTNFAHESVLITYIAEAKATSALLKSIHARIEAVEVPPSGSAVIEKALPLIVSDVEAFVKGLGTMGTISGRAVQLKASA